MLLTLFLSETNAQNSYQIEGHLYNASTKAPVANATIKTRQKTTSSDERGYYNLVLNEGEHVLTLTHIAYDTLQISLILQKDENKDLYLHPKMALMNEVVVSGSPRKSNIRSVSGNVQTLTREDLRKQPAFLGQADPLKTLQTLPGSGKGGEGNSGFYVRGGTAGQNLTLFNEAPIYNPSHLLGFFSVFNAEAIDQVKLYKSAIPSEYGGRLSSIIEVNSSRKVEDSLSIRGDVSILAANTTLALPITSNWSLSVSARKTFMNQTVWPLVNSLAGNGSSFNDMRYDFHDLNLNSNARIGSRNSLNLSAYHGGDRFGFGIRRFNISNGMNWKNSAYSFSWKSILEDRAVLQNTASYSGYNFNFGMTQDKYDANITSQIRDINWKSVLALYFQKHQLKTGLQYTRHRFKPNTPSVSASDTEYDFGLPNIYHSDESSFFLSDEFSVTEKTGINAGARFTYYRQLGPYQLTNEEQETVSFGKNEAVSAFGYIEPSLTLRQLLNQNSSLKLSLSRNIQPLHLISVTAVNFPADFWMPSLRSIPAEKGLQASVGYFRDSGKDNRYESYIDLYYKKMSGLVEFSGGIMNLIDNLKIEENLLFGSGRAYGAEFFLKKNTGKLTGWIGYTLAKSERRFEGINGGNYFPAKYDRTHDLSIVSSYPLTSRWNVNASFTYATGNAYTKPASRYLIGGNIVNEYGPFNGNRMPAYHRMDLAATYKIRNNRKFSTELSLSVYNVYNRQNPVYIYFLAEGDLEKQKVSIRPKSVTLLPVLPAVNYKFSFK